VPTAHSADGILEAFEDPSHPFMIGIQCHPEDLAWEQPFRSLFEAFIAAVRS
jgi:putative glutamine amidotransferase